MKKHLTILIFIFSLALTAPHFAHADITSNLQAWYKFDDGSGTTPIDSSSNANGSSFIGSPAPTWVTGKIGTYALNFGGTLGNNIAVSAPGTSTNDPLTSITVSAWVKVPNAQTQNNQGIFGKLTTNSRWLLFWGLTNNKLSFYVRNNACSAWTTVTTSNSYNDGNWHLVTGTWDESVSGGAVKIYIDGNAEIVSGGTQTTNICGTTPGDTSNTLQIGNYFGSSRPMLGSIDDARLYNRALSASDVLELYNYTGATVAPTVTTQTASSTADTSSILNGNITATGGANATVRGFAYGTASDLSTTIATTTETGSFGTGAFTNFIFGLSCGTTYYSRAYAKNTGGTGFGSIQSLITSSCSSSPPVVRFLNGVIRFLNGRMKIL